MLVIAIIAAIVIAFGFGIYNSLINKKNQITYAFSTIDVMLKKRFDLIPNLVETVKQYMQYEESLLTKVVELRARGANTSLTNEQKLEIDQELSASVRGLMVNVENYPDLKANQSFVNLQSTWTESEEQIAAARRTYNSAVTDYNNAIQMFPGNIFAGMMNYQPATVLSSTEEERKNISAKELFNN